MAFLTNDKLTIVGAAGMIGSNMAQTALMMGLTSEICLYDVFSPEGVAEEMRQSGFDNVNIVATTDAEEAFRKRLPRSWARTSRNTALMSSTLSSSSTPPTSPVWLPCSILA